MSRRLSYQVLDVFTSEALAGNPLAVVFGADALSDARMQAIAGEFNLSETIFLTAPADPGRHAAARIFTPRSELPFAGHPTVGAAVALGLLRQSSRVTIEERVGLIVADVAAADGRGRAEFDLPKLPEARPAPLDAAAIADALGVDAADIGSGGFAPAVWSAGVPYHLVPLRDVEVLARIGTDAARWTAAFPDDRHSVYAFAPGDDADFAARMVRPGLEDPATGGAAASLIGLLAQQAGFATGEQRLTIRQGREMGRPSRIEVYFRKQEGRLVAARVGGEAVLVAEGTLLLD